MLSGRVHNVRRPSDPVPDVIGIRANTSSQTLSRNGLWLREHSDEMQPGPDARPSIKPPLNRPTRSNSTNLHTAQSNSTASYPTQSGHIVRLPSISKESPPSSLNESPSPPRQNTPTTGPCHSVPIGGNYNDKRDTVGHLQQQVLISNEVARLEAETDRILGSQTKTKVDRPQVQKPAPMFQNAARPIYQKLTSLTRAVRFKALWQQPEDLNVDIVKGHTYSTSGLATPSRYTIKPEVEGHGYGPEGKTQTEENGKLTVTVRCFSTTFRVAITRDTFPRDIASAAAKMLSTYIEPDVCVVLESYEEQGLERPLRQYERIHDVVGTWGYDQNNSLTILPHNPMHDLSDLRLASVSGSPPTGFAFQLYHSSHPGNWSKYWVTLSEAGQVFATNQPLSQPVLEHTISLCHLSVCDIYTASDETKLRFQLPAKFCFVIRKQVPATSRHEDDDFVHLFSTDIEQLANRFYELIQRWRSWYIAHEKRGSVLGNELVSQPPSQSSDLQKSLHPASARHKDPTSRVVSSSVIAKWSPLLDMKQFDKPIDEFSCEITPAPEIVRERFSEPTTTTGSPTSSPQPAKQADSKTSQETPQNEIVPILSESDTAAVVGHTKSSEANLPKAPEKSRPSSPMSLPELNMTQPWFPSAVEHSTRIRGLSRGRSHRRLGTAEKSTQRRQRNLKSCMSAPLQLETGHIIRPRPGGYDANCATSPCSMPTTSWSGSRTISGYGSKTRATRQTILQKTHYGRASGSQRSSQILNPPDSAEKMRSAWEEPKKSYYAHTKFINAR